MVTHKRDPPFEEGRAIPALGVSEFLPRIPCLKFHSNRVLKPEVIRIAWVIRNARAVDSYAAPLAQPKTGFRTINRWWLSLLLTINLRPVTLVIRSHHNLFLNLMILDKLLFLRRSANNNLPILKIVIYILKFTRLPISIFGQLESYRSYDRH